MSITVKTLVENIVDSIWQATKLLNI